MMARNRRIREKKHRLPTQYYLGAVRVSITACIKDSRRAFVDAEVVAACIQMLRESATARHCDVPIYCFMPDHLHLILRGLRQEADTWSAMVRFKQRTGFWFSRHPIGVRWQKDFHDHIIRSDKDWKAHVRYIALNPVKAGLVNQWDDYPFTGSIGFDLNETLQRLM